MTDRYIVVEREPWFRVYDVVGARMVGGHLLRTEATDLADRLNAVERRTLVTVRSR